MKSSEEERDRISELPEPIISHIASFLPTDEAIATSALSSEWRDIWKTSLHSLDFGKTRFHHILQTKLASFQGSYKRRRRLREKLNAQFLDFIDQTLMITTKSSSCNHNSIGSFSLYVPKLVDLTPELCSILDRWITHVLDTYQLNDLTFEADLDSKVPLMLLTQVYAFVGGDSLKQLSLSGVKLDSESTEILATNCPFLERLCFYRCTHLVTFQVCGLPKLAEFVLCEGHMSDKLELMHLPNLRSFIYEGPDDYGRCNICFATPFDQLKDVRICNAIFRIVDTHHLAILSKVEHLVLRDCLDPTKLDLSSNYLKSLFIRPKSSFWNTSITDIKIDAPNLQEFTYYGPRHGYTRSLELNYLDLDKASAYLESREIGDFDQLVDFLANFNRCKSLEIHLCASSWRYEDVVINPNERNKDVSPLYNVKHLMLELMTEGESDPSWSRFRDDISETVDFLLWLCPRPDKISISLNKCFKVEELKVLKFKYKEDMKGRIRKQYHCCKFLPNPCWQHCLQEVRIENSKGVDGDMKNYMRRQKTRAKDDDKIKAFFQNARERERIIVSRRD